MKTFRAIIKVTADCVEADELTTTDVWQWLVEQFDGCDLGKVEIGDVTADLSPSQVSRFVELATAPSVLVDEEQQPMSHITELAALVINLADALEIIRHTTLRVVSHQLFSRAKWDRMVKLAKGCLRLREL